MNLIEEYDLNPDFTYFIREPLTGHVLIARSNWFRRMKLSETFDERGQRLRVPNEDPDAHPVLGMNTIIGKQWVTVVIDSDFDLPALRVLSKTESRPFWNALKDAERIPPPHPDIKLWSSGQYQIARTGLSDCWEVLRMTSQEN